MNDRFFHCSVEGEEKERRGRKKLMCITNNDKYGNETGHKSLNECTKYMILLSVFLILNDIYKYNLPLIPVKPN